MPRRNRRGLRPSERSWLRAKAAAAAGTQVEASPGTSGWSGELLARGLVDAGICSTNILERPYRPLNTPE